MEPNLGNSYPSVAAAELYMRANNHFSFEDVAALTDINVDVLKARYHSRADLLRSYYFDSWNRFIEMETSVPDFNQFSVAEKLTTMVFSLCDEFETVDRFALETYDSLMVKHGSYSDLMHLIRNRIRLYLSGDENISMLIKYIPGEAVSTLLAWIMLYLLRERVHDRSDHKDRTSALIDKVTTFSQSVVYTGTVDHLIDLAKYLGITYYSRK
jgi:hypothetical protein